MKRNPFRKSSGNTKRVTPEGEPLEDTNTGSGFPGRRKGVSLVEGQGGKELILISKSSFQLWSELLL